MSAATPNVEPFDPTRTYEERVRRCMADFDNPPEPGGVFGVAREMDARLREFAERERELVETLERGGYTKTGPAAAWKPPVNEAAAELWPRIFGLEAERDALAETLVKAWRTLDAALAPEEPCECSTWARSEPAGPLPVHHPRCPLAPEEPERPAHTAERIKAMRRANRGHPDCDPGALLPYAYFCDACGAGDDNRLGARCYWVRCPGTFRAPEPEEPCECGGDRWVWDHTDDIENPVRVPCPACRPEGEEDRA